MEFLSLEAVIYLSHSPISYGKPLMLACLIERSRCAWLLDLVNKMWPAFSCLTSTTLKNYQRS